jgi:YD repeat-containing protein
MEKKVKKRIATRNNYVYSQDREEWVVETSFLYTKQVFDKHGNLLKDAGYNIFGDFETLNVYQYDEKGNLIEQHIHYDENEIAETHRMENREDGKPLREIVEYADGSVDTVTFSYDDNGYLLEEVEMDADGVVESHEIYEFIKGKMIHEVTFGPEETKMTENFHTYDEKGNLLESKLWNSENGDQGRVVHEYDEKDQRTETLHYNAAGQLIERSIYTYDDKGNVVELEEEDTTGLRRTKFELDGKNNILLQEEHNEAGDLNLRIERSYDEEGQLAETAVFIDRHNEMPEVYYTVVYETEYFQEVIS